MTRMNTFLTVAEKTAEIARLRASIEAKRAARSATPTRPAYVSTRTLRAQYETRADSRNACETTIHANAHWSDEQCAQYREQCNA